MSEVKEVPKKAEATKGPEAEVTRPAAMLMPWTEPTFAFMRRFSEEMDRLFEDFGLGRRLHAPSVAAASCCGARPDSSRPIGRRGSRSWSVTAGTSSAPSCRG